MEYVLPLGWLLLSGIFRAVLMSDMHQQNGFGLDAFVGLEKSNRSFGYGKQCALVVSCVEGANSHVFSRSLEFEVEGRKKVKRKRT